MSDKPAPDFDPTVLRTTDPDITRTGPVDGAGAAAPAPAPASPPSGNALPIGTYLDEFELRSIAGEGGFSIVYRAWDHSLNRQVAVKEYFPAGLAARVGGTQIGVRSERHRETFEAGLKSFVEEARLLAQFDHPALIKVYRFWKANGSAYMVMPFCEGITLRDDWRSRSEPPDEDELMTLLDPLTDALSVLHSEHWYHRDIAPDNVVLLAGSRRPLLLDFGAARQVIGDMTHALTVILKPGYAPIEQWGEVPGMKQGPWTDVYALGAMIHFGITRKTPPPSVGRLVNDNYEPLAVVAAGRYSAQFLDAVDHALAVRPEQRTQSIAQFRAEIGLPESQLGAHPSWPHTLASGAATQARLATQVAPTQPAAPAPGADDPTLFDPRAYGNNDIAAEPRTTPLAPPAAATKRPPVVALAVGAAAVGAVAVAGYMMMTKPAPRPTPGPVPASAPVPAPPQASAPASAVAPAPPPPAEPAPAPAPVPTSPAVGPYDPADQFARVVKAGSADFGVELTLPRTKLRSEHDKLAFTVKAQREGFLYVFNHGADGTLLQLYPNGLSPNIRLRKDQVLRLPVKEDFTITGPAGESHLLVMVSEFKRDHTAFAPRKDGDFTYFPTDSTAATLAGRHAGPLPLIAGAPVCPSTPCTDAFGAAVATFNVVK